FDTTKNANTTGNPFADLLMGNIYSFGQQDRRIKNYNRYKIFEPYFQDDWHATSHLTLNLGLRVSLFGTYREKLHQAFNFDPAHYVFGQTVTNTNGNEANTESLENSPPLATTEQQLNINGYSNIGVGNNPNTQTVFPLGVVTIPTKAIWPYMQQWHLDIQHEVLRNTVLTASYLGSKGTHLTRISDLNQLAPTPLSQNPYNPGEFIDTDP